MSDPRGTQPTFDHAAQEQYPGGYPADTYPAGAYPQPGFTSGRSPLATAALTLALVATGIQLIRTLLLPTLYTTVSPVTIGIIGTISALTALALALTAVVLGISAARRTSKTLVAGMAIGIGGLHVLQVVFSFFQTLLFALAV